MECSGTLRFFCFVFCELCTATCSHRRVREGSLEATTSGTAQGHWHARVIFGSFFQHTLQSPRMKTANSPDNLLQCFVTLTVAKPFLLCNLDLTCCGLNNIIVPLIPGRGGEQLFPSPYENLFLWGCDNISPSSLSTNQLQLFWETFQPIQINIVLQWMWLHTTGKKPVFFFLALTLIVKAMSWARAWNISYCLPVWVITSEIIHDGSILSSHLKLASVKTAQGGIFVAVDLFTSLSYHVTVKYCSCSLILLCADPSFVWFWNMKQLTICWMP